MKRLSQFALALFAMALIALTLATPPANAEVRTKGGALLIRPVNRETANFAYTNDVANPGLPAIFRATTWQGTNHFVITTNGSLAIVGIATNYVGFTGSVATNPGTALYFRNGLLVTTNGVQSVTQ